LEKVYGKEKRKEKRRRRLTWWLSAEAQLHWPFPGPLPRAQRSATAQLARPSQHPLLLLTPARGTAQPDAQSGLAAG